MEHFCSMLFTLVYKLQVPLPYIVVHNNGFCNVWTIPFLLNTWWFNLNVLSFFMNSSTIYISIISQIFDTGKPIYSIMYFKWLVQKYCLYTCITVCSDLLVCYLFITTQSPNLFCLMTVKSMTSEYTSN